MRRQQQTCSGCTRATTDGGDYYPFFSASGERPRRGRPLSRTPTYDVSASTARAPPRRRVVIPLPFVVSTRCDSGEGEGGWPAFPTHRARDARSPASGSPACSPRFVGAVNRRRPVVRCLFRGKGSPYLAAAAIGVDGMLGTSTIPATIPSVEHAPCQARSPGRGKGASEYRFYIDRSKLPGIRARPSAVQIAQPLPYATSPSLQRIPEIPVPVPVGTPRNYYWIRAPKPWTLAVAEFPLRENDLRYEQAWHRNSRDPSLLTSDGSATLHRSAP
jgi:hypothetical protein